MLERRRQLRLMVEASDSIRIPRQLDRQDLDGHVTMESRVGRFPDDAHAPLADLLDQAVVEQSNGGPESSRRTGIHRQYKEPGLRGQNEGLGNVPLESSDRPVRSAIGR
jgi:hypothetical protein